jgi:hypothetical protein
MEEECESLREQVRALKKEKVEILTQHLSDMERIDRLTQLRDEESERVRTLEQQLEQRDSYLRQLLNDTEEDERNNA